MATNRKTLHTKVYRAIVLELMKNYIHDENLTTPFNEKDKDKEINDLIFKLTEVTAPKLTLADVFSSEDKLWDLVQSNPKLFDKLEELNPLTQTKEYIYEIVWYYVEELILTSDARRLAYSGENIGTEREFYRSLYREFTDVYLSLST